MQAKHTPGPWTWQSWNDGIALCAGGCRIMGAFESEHSRRDYPNDANAALIAAAPELLAALQYIDSIAPNDCGADDGNHVEIVLTEKGLRDVRAAIAKATGD